MYRRFRVTLEGLEPADIIYWKLSRLNPLYAEVVLMQDPDYRIGKRLIVGTA